ncbi:MAG: InlB B-repeat-containing protein [Oscillospiraceae bacterium]
MGGGTFKKGETATLEVVPSEGCQFDAWSDGSTQTHRTIKVEENISLTAYFYGPLVDYTPEDEIPQNAVKVGDAKKQYQYQKKEYTTSSQSTLDGWTLYDSSYTWGDYGPFGEWADLGNGVVVEEGQKIERRTVYRYYYFPV